MIHENIEEWLDRIEDPDIILLHIGTNDFGQNYQIENVINRYDALISEITR